MSSMDASRVVLQDNAILAHILQYLSLEQQIDCVDVCDAFYFAIAKTLWKKKYRQLNIYKTPYISVITSNMKDRELDENAKAAQFHRLQQLKTALKYDKCNSFLMQIAKSVHHLRVFSEYFSFQQSLGVAFRNIQMFKNLSSLSYNQMVVTGEQLELIAKSCTKLQKLEFIECSCSELKPLVPDVNLDVRIFARMPQLQELILECVVIAPPPEIECDVLYEMLTNLKLKCLILKNIVTSDSDTDTVQLTNGHCLRTLNTGYISLEFWPDFKHHLREFRNLTNLTINVRDCNTLVNASVLEILTLNCLQLQSLSLENCDFYIEDFGILRTVQHLTLRSCGGFTADNLQQVLGSLLLKSFTLINTRVLGVIDDIYVSPALELLTVDTLHFTNISEAFQKSVNNMQNLHTIKWLNGVINDSWIIDKCPQLKVLHIPNPYLLRRHILKMTSLQELSFTSCSGFSWCFLVILVKNLMLKRLNIHTTDAIDELKEIPENACNVRTSLQRIIMPFHIFKMAQDFWLDLLNINHSMKLVFYGDHVDLLNANFLRSLIRYEYVWDHLTNLKICGFPVDIKALKINFDEVLYQMNTTTSHYRARNSKFTIEL